MVNVLKDLIALPSYSGIPGQETATAKYIFDFFQKENIESKLVHVRDNRFNVMAKISGNGKGKNILLTGHTDTVPPYDFENANKPVIIDGKLFGRGANDMKGPIVSMMFAMAAIKRSGISTSGDIIFAGVIDEEINSYGTKKLISDGINADYAIVGEPSDLKLFVGHKGLEWMDIYFIGKSAHGGAYKDGINAIYMATKFIEKLNRDVAPKIFSRTHNIVGEATINVGYIHGGTQPSTVPGDCMIRLDRRFIPGEKYNDVVGEIEDLLSYMHKEDAEFNYRFVAQDRDICADGFVHPPMTIDLDDEFVISMGKSIERVLKKKPDIGFFSAWSDGGLLCESGIPTIIFGPGDIHTAHTNHEHIFINDMLLAAQIYADISLNISKLEAHNDL
ncbi:MAG: M20 family metallopeptidase [Sedimentibacter sp.]